MYLYNDIVVKYKSKYFKQTKSSDNSDNNFIILNNEYLNSIKINNIYNETI